MAKKISQLTQATEVKSDDVTVIVQDGETKKLPLNMMVTKQDIENKKVAGLAKLDEIEATYENDTYTPTITVKNKSSVKVGEGDGVDYSANVMDGHAKSAILKGQTLVNLFNFEEANTDGIKNSNKSFTLNQYQAVEFTSNRLKNTFTAYIIPNNLTIPYTIHTLTELDVNIVVHANVIGISSLIIESNEETSKFRLYNESSTTNTYKILLLDGIQNEPKINDYFEDMQSVKTPVLTTTGKNLFDIDTMVSNYATVENGVVIKTGNVGHTAEMLKITNLEVGKTYTLSCDYSYDGTSNGSQLVYCLSYDDGWYNSSKNNIKTYTGNISKINESFIAQKDTVYLIGSLWQTYISNIQIEKGATATPYEPYKSNILTVNEDVVLNGVNDLKDTLNLLTGELSKKVGVAKLSLIPDADFGDFSPNGVNGALSNTANINIYKANFNKYFPPYKDGLNAMSNFAPVYNTTYNKDYECFALHGDNKQSVQISLSHSRFNGDLTKEKMIQLIKEMDITIVYQLAESTIKTVDLMPSGTHPSTTPYCWKNGHIQLSSSGLLPNLEYSVVTSRAGQINQNATMVVKNDKRIFDLEILLAGGLVNTTYQALTLQNQVETGLSKVSLNSETEPDYLLYHMIMKLIEEKAYKLDDLTEKVSVFYLYEKLSDEQFETIYAALYPFVEDEYDELPEEAENEVVM